MKPSKLNAGQIVHLNGRRMTFIGRDRDRRVCTLRCDAYRGLYGPNDIGDVEVTDAKLARYGKVGQ